MNEMKMKKVTRILAVVVVALAVLVAVVGVKTYKMQKERAEKEKEVSESQVIAEITSTVTIPEGFSVSQIGTALEENEVCNAKEFLDYVKNPPEEVLKDLGIESTENKIFVLEGYIFPDTYEFYKNEKVSTVVEKFLDNFKSKVTDEYYQKAKNSGYTMDEIISIASIIQKESGYVAENGKVSSVIYNRLDSGMQIQCDVSSNYLEKFVEPYVDNYADVKETYANNYDTFKCSGVPAGAICNPGIECINAALNPEDTDYLFFVTDKNDTSKFYFSKTYEEHLANCKIAGYSGY